MNRLLPCSLATLLAAGALGCDEGQKPGTSTSAPAAPASASITITSASAATKPALAPTVAAGDPGQYGHFTVVARGEAISLYPLAGSAIVDTGAFFAVLGDGPLEQDPQLFRASIEKEPGKIIMTPIVRYTAFWGSWPDQAWASAEHGLMKRVNDIWTKQDFLRDGERLLDMTPWDKKRMVAAIRMAEPDIRFTLVGSSSGGVIPAPGKPTPEQEGCAVRMDPEAPLKIGGLPTGHMFAVGKECKTGKIIAERWAPGKVRGEVEVIDGVSGAPIAVAAASGEEAYALFVDGTTASLATWDGQTWKGEKATFGAATRLWISADGTTWVLGEGKVHKRPKGGEWREITAGRSRITSAWARDEKTLWVVADGKVLLRSGPSAAAPIELPSASVVQQSLDRDRRWPATAACKRVYVLLAPLGGDKAPTSFPALTEAVKGDPELGAKEIQYLVEDIGGALHAGAKLPSLPLADKLVAAFKAKNPKYKPMVFCHEPMFVKGALKVD